ncbi:DUF4014 family protein [Escherichia coli]|nr:DUF4014 family protein [Escherichia coli]EHQ6228500.1 DUF4014 family protein [Escherichia coli]EIK2730252.1 DUF4014 family protein [Escherichia coli]EIO6840682.1 DUF4014 family protein [Escherichia coli]EIU9699462.1 DUF4014 family protein [Escherichia coli]
MKHYLEKNYPRKSRTTEFLFFILFIVLMNTDIPAITGLDNWKDI